MRIDRIHIRNIHSLQGPLTINFTEPPLATGGLFAITGDTGAGKTTILDAVTLALYGKIARNESERVSTPPITYGSIEALAEVDFSSGGKQYRAKWSVWRAHKKPDGNLLGPNRELAVWEESKQEYQVVATKIREVDDGVLEACGLDYKRFKRSVLLAQGDFTSFLQADAEDRSDLLERITGTSIYSDISKAAFDRYKLAKEKLDVLEIQRQSLQLLSEDDRHALKAQQKQLETETEQLKKEVSTWLEWQNLYTQHRNTQHRISSLQTSLQEQQRAWDDLLPQRQLLELAKKAAPLFPLHTQRESLVTTANALQTELDKNQLAWKDAAAHLQTATEEQQQAIHNQTTIQHQWHQWQPRLEQARLLTVQIDRQQQEYKVEQQELEQWSQQRNTRQAEQRKRLEEQALLQQKKQEVDAWLQENAVLESLAGWLPQMQDDWQELSATRQLALSIRAEWQACNTAVEATRSQLQLEQAEVPLLNQQLEQALADFRNELPEELSTNRDEALQLLRRQIEQKSQTHQELQKAWDALQAYREALRTLDDYEVRLQHLTHERNEYQIHIMNSLDILEAVREHLQYKRAILEQQQAIANYEKDRQQLQAGEPCPLCMSTDHPFRLHGFKPYVDKAREEFAQAQQQEQAIHKQYLAQISRLQHLDLEIAQLQSEENRQHQGQMEQLQRQIGQLERDIQQYLPTNGEQTDFTSWASNVEKLEADIAIWKIRSRFLENKNLEIRKLEEKRNLTESGVREKELHLAHAETQSRQLSEKMAACQQTGEMLATRLQERVSSLGLSWDTYKQSGVEPLHALHTHWVEQQKNARTWHENRQLAAQAIRLAEEDFVHIGQQYEKAEARLKARQVELEQLTRQRVESLGEYNSPEALELHWAHELQTADEKVKTANAAYDKAQALSTQTQARQQTLQEQQEQTQALIQEKAADLEQKAQSLGFISYQTAVSAIRSSESMQSLEEPIRQVQEQLSALITQLRTAQTDLEALQPLLPEAYTSEQVQEQAQVQQTILQQKMEALGSCKSELERQRQLLKQSKTLQLDMENEKKETSRWELLNQAIGSKDGKKFRAFAQSLTLQHLVDMANQRLQLLSDRYLLDKQPDESLALEMVDTYQADNRRSVYSLSGGESFLVSLALALALSDMASRQARIDTLFIDEGFGALDENTLDTALHALENLQSGGKTIGVISHIKEMKERIHTQIRVTKKGNGISEVEVVA